MTSKRTVGLQMTPRLLPVSFATVEVVGSGSPPPIALIMGGAPRNSEDSDVSYVETAYARRMRPKCTLLLMNAASPQALSMREADIEALRLAYDEAEGREEKLSRAAAIHHFETDRSSYLMAIIRAGEATNYVSPTMAHEKDAPSGEIDQNGVEITTFEGEIHPDAQFWAFGLPAPIPIRKCPDRRPTEVPLSDLLADSPFIGNEALSSDGTRALPVVDPLLILRGAAERYNQACDRYLLHVGEFASGNPRTKLGSLLFYKSQVSNLLERLPADLLKDGEALLALENAKKFTKAYNGEAANSNSPGHEGLKQLLEQREEAAHGLIRWLESEALAVIPGLYRNPDGSFDSLAAEQGYLAYVDGVLMAHSRLTESERGKIYLTGMLEQLDSAPPSHPWAVISTFVLTRETPSDSTAAVAREASKGIVGLWLKLFPFVLERVAKHAGDYDVSGSVYSRVNQAVQKLTDQIAYLFDGPAASTPLVTLVDTARSKFQIQVQNSLAELNVGRLQLRISKDRLAGVLGASKGAATMLEQSLELLNASIAFASCWEAARDSKVELSHLGDGLGLLKSVAFFAEHAVSRELRRATLEAARQQALEKLTARLTLAGTVMDLALTGVKTWDNYRGGDKDAASAELVAGSTGVLGTVMLTVSGPVGWTLLALSLGVALYGQTLKDVPFDKLAKFSPFGSPGIRRSSLMDDQDKAWTMAESYNEWDPSTRAGLERWLSAAAQLAYGFTVRGHTPQAPGFPRDGHVRIEAQQPFLPATRLHVRIHAKYVNQELGEGIPYNVVAHFWVLSLLGTPTLADYSGKYVMEDAVEVIDRRIVELALRQVEPYMAKDRGGKLKYVDLDTLIVEVRLDVHGDGDPMKFGEDATLIVPTTKGGKKSVRAEVLTALKPGPEARSFDASNHA